MSYADEVLNELAQEKQANPSGQQSYVDSVLAEIDATPQNAPQSTGIVDEVLKSIPAEEPSPVSKTLSAPGYVPGRILPEHQTTPKTTTGIPSAIPAGVSQGQPSLPRGTPEQIAAGRQRLAESVSAAEGTAGTERRYDAFGHLIPTIIEEPAVRAAQTTVGLGKGLLNYLAMRQESPSDQEKFLEAALEKKQKGLGAKYKAERAQNVEALRNYAKQLDEFMQSDYFNTQAEMTPFRKLLGIAGGVAGSITPVIAITALTKSPYPAAFLFGMTGSGETYEEARAKGLKVDEAQALANIRGAVDTALGIVALDKVPYLKQAIARQVPWKQFLTGNAISATANLATIINKNLVARGYDSERALISTDEALSAMFAQLMMVGFGVARSRGMTQEQATQAAKDALKPKAPGEAPAAVPAEAPLMPAEQQMQADIQAESTPLLGEERGLGGRKVAPPAPTEAESLPLPVGEQPPAPAPKGAAPEAALPLPTPEAKVAPAPEGQPLPLPTAEPAPAPAPAKGIGAGLKAKVVATDLGKWAHRMLSPTKGMGEQLYGMGEANKSAKASGILAAEKIEQEFRETMDSPIQTHGYEKVSNALMDVLTGDKSIAQFAKEMGVAGDGVEAKYLGQMRVEVEKARQALLDAGNKAGWPQEMLDAIDKNVFYLPRIYMRFIMGERFKPNESDVADAVDAVTQTINNEIKTFKKGKTALGEKYGKNVDEYLESGDIRKLGEIDPDDAADIQKTYSLKERVGGLLRDLTQEQDIEIRKAAQDVVAAALDPQIEFTGKGGAMGNRDALIARTITPAFRKLFQPVTDPFINMRNLSETRALLTEQARYMDTVYKQGQDKWWSARPRPELGLSRELPNDKLKLGRLAGMHVSPALYDELVYTPKLNDMPVFKQMNHLRTWLRMIRLAINPGNILERNPITNLSEYAVGSGDIKLPNYGKHLGEGAKLVVDFLKGKTEAIGKMAEFVRKPEVFILGQSGLSAELGKKMGPSYKRITPSEWLAQKYSLTDFPFKYASYKSDLEKNLKTMTPEAAEQAAIDHVTSFYNTPSRIPEAVHRYGRMPFGADFPVFFMDNIRIVKNQAVRAAEALKDGNPIPAMEFSAARAMLYGRLKLQGLIVSTVGAGIVKWYRGKDKEGLEQGEPEVHFGNEQQLAATREFVADWSENELMTPFYSVDQKTGKRLLHVLSMPGMTSDIAGEMMLGSVLAATPDKGPIRRMADQLWQNYGLGSGMTENFIGKHFFGYDIQKTRPTSGEGLIPLMMKIGKDDPNWGDKIKKRLGEMAPEALAGSFAGMIKRKMKFSKGQAPESGVMIKDVNWNETLKNFLSVMKVTTYDDQDLLFAISSKTKDIARYLGESKQGIRQPIKEQAKLRASSPASLAAAARGAEERRKVLGKLIGLAANAQVMANGIVTDDEIYAAIKDAAGLTNDEMSALKSGTTDVQEKEYRPNLTALERLERGSPLGGLGRGRGR